MRPLFIKFVEFVTRLRVSRGLEPIAAIGEPPTGVTDGDRCGQRPPERKRHVGDETEYAEGDPKYFPLHVSILAPSAESVPRRQQKVFQIEMPSGRAIPMISTLMRNVS